MLVFAQTVVTYMYHVYSHILIHDLVLLTVLLKCVDVLKFYGSHA